MSQRFINDKKGWEIIISLRIIIVLALIGTAATLGLTWYAFHNINGYSDTFSTNEKTLATVGEEIERAVTLAEQDFAELRAGTPSKRNLWLSHLTNVETGLTPLTSATNLSKEQVDLKASRMTLEGLRSKTILLRDNLMTVNGEIKLVTDQVRKALQAIRERCDSYTGTLRIQQALIIRGLISTSKFSESAIRSLTQNRQQIAAAYILLREALDLEILLESLLSETNSKTLISHKDNHWMQALLRFQWESEQLQSKTDDSHIDGLFSMGEKVRVLVFGVGSTIDLDLQTLRLGDGGLYSLIEKRFRLNRDGHEVDLAVLRELRWLNNIIRAIRVKLHAHADTGWQELLTALMNTRFFLTLFSIATSAGFLLLAIHIHRRVKAQVNEIEVTRNQALSASRTKSAFLANMSHELRTPMNAIIGYSEMLMEEAQEQGHHDYVPDLKKIQSAGKHLLELINSVLDLSKIEAGKMDLYLESVDIKELVDGILGTIEPLALNNNNSLRLKILPDIGSMRTDVTKLRQILLNILSNASKFTKDGSITLSVRMHDTSHGEQLAFEISDTGIGMTQESLSKLFQEFSQADSSTTRKYGGTGLGLSLSRKFCELMGGEIKVTSEPGKGSVFTISLPRVVADGKRLETGTDSSAHPINQATANGGGPLALVIDDDGISRDLMARTLEKEGFKVMTADGGKEGLSLAKKHSPNIIALDVLMPEMDGWAILQELKKDPNLAKIPVFMTSVLHEKERAYAVGVSDFLTKPIDREALVNVLSKYKTQKNDQLALIIDDD